MTVSIDTKALQLTIILLRQTQPILSRLLPKFEQHTSDEHVDLDLSSRQVGMIVNALTDLGNEWLSEAQQTTSPEERNSLRQKTISFLLREWIHVGESFEEPKKRTLH